MKMGLTFTQNYQNVLGLETQGMRPNMTLRPALKTIISQ